MLDAIEEYIRSKGREVEYFCDEYSNIDGIRDGKRIWLNLGSDTPVTGVAIHECIHLMRKDKIREFSK